MYVQPRRSTLTQTLELYCVQSGLAAGIANATFEHDMGVTKWKYRGQLTPKADRCDVEVHVTKVEKAGDEAKFKIEAMEDANQWKKVENDVSAESVIYISTRTGEIRAGTRVHTPQSTIGRASQSRTDIRGWWRGWGC